MTQLFPHTMLTFREVLIYVHMVLAPSGCSFPLDTVAANKCSCGDQQQQQMRAPSTHNMSGRRREEIGTDRHHRPILPMSGRHREDIGTDRHHRPTLPMSGRCREDIGNFAVFARIKPDIGRCRPDGNVIMQSRALLIRNVVALTFFPAL